MKSRPAENKGIKKRYAPDIYNAKGFTKSKPQQPMFRIFIFISTFYFSIQAVQAQFVSRLSSVFDGNREINVFYNFKTDSIHEDSERQLKGLMAALQDSSPFVRAASLYRLMKTSWNGKLPDNCLQKIASQVNYSKSRLTVSALSALGTQQSLDEKYLNQIVPLLKDDNSEVRSSVWQSRYSAPPNLWYYAFPFIVDHALLKDDRFREDSEQSRVPLYEVAGTNDTIVYLLKWLCRPSAYPEEIPIVEASKTLDLMMNFEVDPDSNLFFKQELIVVLPKLIEAAKGGWASADLPNLEKALALIGNSNPEGAIYIQDLINSLKVSRWVWRFGMVWGIHLFFWTLLIFFYPFFPMIQAIFFWNTSVRKWLGLGYVSFLISWIPFLRQRIFMPFSESLLAEAFPNDWQEDEYFPDSQVFSAREKKTLPVAEAILPLRGQVLLQGESGLGKTMFLRNLVKNSSRVIAFLPASRCAKGLIQAIQNKVHGTAADPVFLKKLIYAGAIDVLIDGINEISAGARAQLTVELERYFKGNLLLTTQPMEWEVPVSAKLFVLKPLTEKQIEAFLLSRYPYLEQVGLVPESAYKQDCKAYLEKAFSNELDKGTLISNQHILSNPMDLVLVAQLIARGESPSLLDLQEQQYQLMAVSYKTKNMGNAFPLKKFASRVYKMRLNDQPEIPTEGFKKALLAMRHWKMVVSRQEQEDINSKPIERWYFRHDKIQEYFIAQEFLRHPELCEKHMDDPRFRGVYFLLSYKLPYKDAMVLRERLIQHAAKTKDHSLSDTFIQLIHRRPKPQKNILQEIRGEISDALVTGQTKKAIQLLRKHANGDGAKEAVLLANRDTELTKEILGNTISSESAQIKRNQINKAIIELVDSIE